MVVSQAFDEQPRAEGNGEHKQQVEFLEVPGVADKQQNDDKNREDPEEHQRAPGEWLPADETQDQVVSNPDHNAGDVDQYAKCVQPIEFMLEELGLELSRRRFFQHFVFNGFVHRRPCPCAGCRESPCPRVGSAGRKPMSGGNPVKRFVAASVRHGRVVRQR
ncbi:hypothetical protein D3C81_633010 [compost metagenome]